MQALERTKIRGHTLQPQRFIQTIQRQAEFLKGLPEQPLAELAPEDRRERLQRAVASGALAAAERREEDHGEYDLDANLYRLIGNLGPFHESSLKIDQLREEFGSPRAMPRDEKRSFYDNKKKVTQFNHVLHEVINAGASRFDFDELLGFMVKMRAASGSREHAGEFYTQARGAVVGMRNEMSVEQALIAAGIDYTLGDPDQDGLGGDIFIAKVPIDLKASYEATEQAKEKARREGRNPDRIVWSHIEFREYEGKLTLPYELTEEIYTRMKPDLDKALQTS